MKPFGPIVSFYVRMDRLESFDFVTHEDHESAIDGHPIVKRHYTITDKGRRFLHDDSETP